MKLRKSIFIILATITVFVIGWPVSSFAAEGKPKSTLSAPASEKSKPSSLSSPAPPAKVIKKVTVYCCVRGRVVTKVMSEANAKKSSASCSTSRSKTESFCGVCCTNGKATGVSSSKEKDVCTRKGGRFYKSAAECKPDDIYCCLEGVVKKVSPGVCKKKRGKAYTSERDARANCGWCCAKNKVFSATPGECRQNKGKYSSSRKKADQECVVQSQCCINGKLVPYAKVECKKNNGHYYPSPWQAKSQCRPRAAKGSLQDTEERTFIPGSIQGRKPFRLPDLDVVSTSVNAKCFMKVTIQNIGGPIKASEHAAAKIHLSAGAGLVSTKTKLISIDPGGQLRTPGGSITYTTKLRITEPNQATLVWVDTEHHITESNEINNGDDAQLTCRTPLVWCCADGKVSRLSKDDCKRLRGTFYKTEAAARKACGVTPGSLPPAAAFSAPKKEKSAITPMREMHGKVPAGATIPPEIPDMVPMIYDMGIRVTLPSSTTRLYQGETFTVRYQFTREVGEGDVSFTAVNRGTAIGVTSLTVSYNPLTDGLETREVELTLPSDVPVGEYFIMAGHSESGAHGESDPFRVEMNSARITLHRPDTGDLFHPGGSLAISYQFGSRVEPGIITFSLYTLESGTPLATMTQSHTPVSADRPLEKSWTIDFPIPFGISSDHCFIVATHPKAMGTSNIFSIQPMTLSMPEPSDLEVFDIVREDDGQVKARIRLRNFSGSVDLQVNGSPTFITAVVGPEETDVVVADMPTPLMGLGLDSYLGGTPYEVTVDPLNVFPEIDETNNTFSKNLYYWDSYGEVFVHSGGERISSGGTIRIPCDLSSYERSTINILFVMKNYGADPILRAESLVEASQSGRRPRGGGSLGDEDFTDVLTVPFFVSDCSLGGRRIESTVPSGECGLLRIGLDDLTGVDSRLTFRTSGPVASWPLTVNPYTVHINFGEYEPFSGHCSY